MAKGETKNNPRNRSREKLYVYSPINEKPMTIVKVVANVNKNTNLVSGMYYKDESSGEYFGPLVKDFYKEFRWELISSK